MSMFLGLRTTIYHVSNMDAAREWYKKILGSNPTFDEPFYIGFDISGYELGLQPADPSEGTSDRVVSYWGVENIDIAYARLLELGATMHSSIQDVGDGIKVATVKDPFGNTFGIIQNDNFKKV